MPIRRAAPPKRGPGAYAIIQETQQAALGKTEPFDIRPPSETLRERLLLSHGLPYSSSASLGTRHLTPIPHWPKDRYLEEASVPEDATAPWFSDSNYRLTLLDALQVAARNSREYQTRKNRSFERRYGWTWSGMNSGIRFQDSFKAFSRRIAGPIPPGGVFGGARTPVGPGA
jgi:hypothetical protein